MSKTSKNKFIKFLKWFGISLLIFVVLLLIFIQTDCCNKLGTCYLQKSLNEDFEKNNLHLEIASIKGNILCGKLNINKVLIKGKEDTLLNLPATEVQYNVFTILSHVFKKKIYIESIIFDKPSFDLVRNATEKKDSFVWNVEYFLNSLKGTGGNSNSKPFTFSINDIKFENGTVNFIRNKDDPKRFSEQKDFIHSWDSISNIFISNLDLDLSLDYFTDKKSVDLRNLSFYTNSEITVNNLAFRAFVDGNARICSINDLHLITNRTNTAFSNFNIEDADPFEENFAESLMDKVYSLKASFIPLHAGDVKFFSVLDSGLNEEAKKMNGTINMEFDVNGKINDINVNMFSVSLDSTNIKLKGRIKNIEDTSKFTAYDLIMFDSKINPYECSNFYNEQILSDRKDLRIYKIEDTISGTFKRIENKFRINSNAGDIEGRLSLNEFTYSGDIKSFNFDLGKCINKDELKSNLNSGLYFSGTGYPIENKKFVFGKLNAKLECSFENSSIAGYNINRLNGNFNCNASAGDLKMDFITNVADGNIVGKINAGNFKNIIYNLKGKFHKLNFAAAKLKNLPESNLNFDFIMDGSGLNAENPGNFNSIRGKYGLDFDNSNYSKYSIPRLKVEINKPDRNGKIDITSDLADVNAAGTFDEKTIDSYSNVVENLSRIIKKLKYKYLPADSGVTENNDTINSETGDLGFNISIKTKDEARLNAFLDQFEDEFDVNFSGNISGNFSNDNASMKAGVELEKVKFHYSQNGKDNDSGISVSYYFNPLDPGAYLRFQNNYKDSSPNITAPFKIDIHAAPMEFSYNSLKIDTPKINISMDTMFANFDMGAKYKNIHGGKFRGYIDLRKDDVILNFDSLRLRIFGVDSIVNAAPAVLMYSTLPGKIITLSAFKLQKDTIGILISGTDTINGTGSAALIINDTMRIPDYINIYNKFAQPDTDIVYHLPLDAAVSKFGVVYKGDFSFKDLDLNFDLGNTDVFYRNKYSETYKMGMAKGRIIFNDSVFAPFISVEGDNSDSIYISGDFKTGKITFGTISDKLDPDTLKSDSLNLNMLSSNFRIKYLSKIFSDDLNLEGELNSNVNARGNLKDITANGFLNVENGRLTFPATRMIYGYRVEVIDKDTARGTYRPSIDIVSTSDKKKFEHLKILGEITTNGLSFFEKDKLVNAELRTYGSVALLSSKIPENQIGVNGDVILKLDDKIKLINRNLTITGNNSILKAEFFTIDPPDKGYDAFNDNIVYRVAGKKPADSYSKIGLFNSPDISVNFDCINDIKFSLDLGKTIYGKIFGALKPEEKIWLTNKNAEKQLKLSTRLEVYDNTYVRLVRNFFIFNSNLKFYDSPKDPLVDLDALYQKTSTFQRYDQLYSDKSIVDLTAKGNIELDKGNVVLPKIDLGLRSNRRLSGQNNKQQDAINLLLFGRYGSDLYNPLSIPSIAGNAASAYLSSFISYNAENWLPELHYLGFNYSDNFYNNLTLKNSFKELILELFLAKDNYYLRYEGSPNNIRKSIYNFGIPVGSYFGSGWVRKFNLEFFQDQLDLPYYLYSSSPINTGFKLQYKIR